MPPTIVSGWVTEFFLYDIAEAIDLAAVSRLIGSTTSARMTQKAPAPPYIQYAHPPIAIDGHAIDMPTLGAWHVRFKIFDYGVLSLALTRANPETWEPLVTHGMR